MPSDALVFRDYRPEDKATLIQLLGGGRPAHYIDRKQAVFEWQFFGNPPSAPCSPFIIGTLGDEIVAAHGLMPVRARVAGRTCEACWSVDIYVSASLRGRGHGRTIIDKGGERSPVMLVFGISDLSDPIFARGGWVADPAMSTLFFHAQEVGLKGFVKNLSTKCTRAFRFQRGRSALELSSEGMPADGVLDALWARVQGHYPNAVVRDCAYLGWRYGRSPLLAYRWVMVRRNGEVHAIVVTRHDPIESVIADYVGPLDDPELMCTVMDFACQDLLASGTRRIRCEANHRVVLGALTAIGFRHFYPAGRFRMRVNLPPSLGPSGKWFVMTGDSDNDLFVL